MLVVTMLARIIFCSAVLLATLAVILLALFSPLPKRKPSPPPWLDLSLYIQQPQSPNIIDATSSNNNNDHVAQSSQSDGGGAFIFHRMLTEGPENTSRLVGKAQGFIIPVEHFANSGFNIIYLTFHTPQYSGSLSVEAKHVSPKDNEELTVMGGTGSFAFARGLAVFAQSIHGDATYHVKLQLRFPNNQSRTTTIPG
ncbi:dirigent protein 6 [Prunus yedoensis var. nudiflora]|uniref:Dirigent protein n=1 Tax=Prunus yedoensis var. nudiflora TaxID=2094558 RepID=A0A315AJC4_PRUYE|nr:dirigent protein 6 [Prunus yedoensis var. nudiflora]